jgi:hypothetical protein
VTVAYKIIRHGSASVQRLRGSIVVFRKGPSAGTRSSGTFVTPGTDELPNTVIHGGPVAQRWDKGEAQRAVGDLVPYDPSYETPDVGALTDAQQRTESLRDSSPAKYNLPFLSLAQSLLSL